MQAHSLRRAFSLRSAALVLAAGMLSALPAQAYNKDMDQLQERVSTLMDMVQRLQSTVDSKFGLVQHLVEQSTDNVNQMNAAITAMQQKLNAQSESSTGKLDAVSGQVQSLNDSLDELKSRIAKLDKQMQDIQSQLQNVQAPPAGGSPAPGAGPEPAGQQPGGIPAAGGVPAGPGGAAGAQAPPLDDIYQGGLRDYNAAHYDVAAAEFTDVLHYYPNDDLAGNAQFYLGEISYRQQKYKDAIKFYNAVLENFSGNPKAPASQLRKGTALIQLNQKEAGINELRSLLRRYPQTPEAVQARSKLNAMGVRIVPR